MPLIRKRIWEENGSAGIPKTKKQRKCYTLMDNIGFTDDQHHILSHKLPWNIDDTRNDIGRKIVSLLNTTGGVIVYGVRHTGAIYGDKISRKEEDNLKNIIDDAVKRMIPSVGLGMYEVIFTPVIGTGEREGHQVLTIKVNPGDPFKLYEDLNHEVYRREGTRMVGPLTPHQIKDITIQQLKQNMQRMVALNGPPPGAARATSKTASSKSKSTSSVESTGMAASKPAVSVQSTVKAVSNPAVSIQSTGKAVSKPAVTVQSTVKTSTSTASNAVKVTTSKPTSAAPPTPVATAPPTSTSASGKAPPPTIRSVVANKPKPLVAHVAPQPVSRATLSNITNTVSKPDKFDGIVAKPVSTVVRTRTRASLKQVTPLVKTYQASLPPPPPPPPAPLMQYTRYHHSLPPQGASSRPAVGGYTYPTSYPAPCPAPYLRRRVVYDQPPSTRNPYSRNPYSRNPYSRVTGCYQQGGRYGGYNC